jgi:hypothetical protein
MLKLSMLLLTTMVASLIACVCKAQEVIYTPQTIRIHESGSFGGKVWHEMDTQEFTGAMTAVCSYFGCTSAVPAMAAAIHNTQIINTSEIVTTGRIDKHAGEEWLIAFPAPTGYVACSAAYDSKSISANGGDATSGIIFRNPGTGENWLGSYDEVPKNRPEGHWVYVNFVVKYVLAGTEVNNQCVPNGTSVWSVNR